MSTPRGHFTLAAVIVTTILIAKLPFKSQRMMTSSNGNIFRVTGPLCGEFTGPGEFPAQRPVTRSFDVFFDLGLNKRLSKQRRGWWFEMPSWSLWRQCNGFSWRLSTRKFHLRVHDFEMSSGDFFNAIGYHRTRMVAPAMVTGPNVLL